MNECLVNDIESIIPSSGEGYFTIKVEQTAAKEQIAT